MSAHSGFPGELPGPLPRLGLRGEILVAFATVTLFAIGLNTFVVWRIDSMLLRRERIGEAAASVRWMAAALGGAPSQPAAERLAREVEGVEAFLVHDASGSERARVGEPPTDRASIEAAVRATLLLGDGAVEVVERGARTLVRVVSPVGGRGSRSGVAQAWIRLDRPSPAAARSRRLSAAYVALNSLLAGCLGWWLVSRSVVRPLTRLTEATRRVADGDLEVRVAPTGTREMSELARDFNRMTERLAERRREVIEAEKMASVGRLAAGLAHELGNPIGAVTGYVSMLRRGKTAARNPDDAETLRRMESEMRRIDRIVRDLLD